MNLMYLTMHSSVYSKHWEDSLKFFGHFSWETHWLSFLCWWLGKNEMAIVPPVIFQLSQFDSGREYVSNCLILLQSIC